MPLRGRQQARESAPPSSGPSSEGSASEEDEVGEEVDGLDLNSFDFSDLLGSIDFEEFAGNKWGKECHSSRVSDDLLEKLREGFCNGDFAEVAARCRKDDNSLYSNEEIGDMEQQLESKMTINLPFCYSRGALQIKQCFIEQDKLTGNDVEVGLYFSRVGGAPATWHYDNNHNLTIQISGEKEWLCAKGDVRTTASRSLYDPPGSAFDSTRPHPETDPSKCERYSLYPGCLLYVPPGTWHSVIPSKGRSFSIDLRVANILQAKWACEALFLALTSRKPFPTYGPGQPKKKKVSSAEGVPLAVRHYARDAEAYALAAADEVGNAMHFCPMPRLLPFQLKETDGMELGASLDFLVDHHVLRKFVLENAREYTARMTATLNPLIAFSIKQRGDDQLVLHMRSVSSLTSSEYFRFSIVMRKHFRGVIEMLQAQDQVQIRALEQVFESCLDEKDGFALDEAMFEAKNACHACTLDGLLSVLEKAKVITIDDEEKMYVGGAGSSSTPGRLREASAAGARLKKRPRH